MARAGGNGLFATLRRLVATLVAIGRTRLELLGTELQEEKTRLLGALASGVAALFLLGLGITLAVVFLVAAFWEQRVAILGLSTLAVLGGGFFLFNRAKRLISQPTNLFQASVAELDNDLERLRDSLRERP